MTSVAAGRSVSTANAFRLLIWLKWTLLLRAYSRQPMRVVGAVIMLLVFAPLSIGAGVFCYLFTHDSPVLPALFLRAALGLAYAIWLITPLLGFPLNESYDPGRLFVYPVPLRTIFAANVIGGLMELSTLLALPVIVSLLILFCNGFVAAILACAAVLLFLCHTLAMAQLIMLSMIGFLRSRRFRDITIVVLPLIAVAFYIAQQALVRGMVQFDPRALLTTSFWGALDWFPPGWATHAAQAARDGSFGVALAYIAALAIAAVVPVLLAASVLNGLYLGDRGPAADQAEAVAESPAGEDVSLAARGELFALARKERVYLVREPAYKALGVNTLYTLAALFFGFLQSGSLLENHTSASPLTPGMPEFVLIIGVIKTFSIPTVLLLATLPLTFNIFGGDASAITVLLSFPTPRWKILVGKNIAYAPVVLIVCGLGEVVASVLTKQIDMMPLGLVWVLLATPVVVGVGNLVSVRFPHKMVVRGQRWGKGGQVSFGSGPTGCGYAFLYLLCYLGSFAMLSPVAAAVVGPVLIGNAGILALTIPLAVIYSVFVYWGATILAVRLMARRESEIIGTLAPDE
jgi:hypothetical protein